MAPMCNMRHCLILSDGFDKPGCCRYAQNWSPLAARMMPAEVCRLKEWVGWWRPLDATADRFVPELNLQVSDRAEYRVVDLHGNGLSPWFSGGPDVALVIRCIASIDRTADGEYELIVERRMPGKTVKQFHVPFSLKPSGT